MYMVASRDNYGNSASVIYMDALPTVLIESLLGHLHAAALARAQQVNHSFRALAQAVAAFIVQQRNVVHMLRHSETHVQLLRRLELRPSIMVRDTTWIDFCTAEGNIREVREELIQWCGVMVTPRSGERGSNLKRARHASLSGKVYLLVAQNMHGHGPVTIKVPEGQRHSIPPGSWSMVGGAATD